MKILFLKILAFHVQVKFKIAMIVLTFLLVLNVLEIIIYLLQEIVINVQAVQAKFLVKHV